MSEEKLDAYLRKQEKRLVKVIGQKEYIMASGIRGTTNQRIRR